MGVESLLLGALALGGSVYQQRQQQRAQRKASDAADAQNRAFQSQLQQEQTRQNNMGQQDADTVLAARARQKALASSAIGKQDSILTSPLGLQTPANTASKNLLGS